MRRLLALTALLLGLLGGCAAEDTGGGIELPGGTAPLRPGVTTTTTAPAAAASTTTATAAP